MDEAFRDTAFHHPRVPLISNHQGLHMSLVVVAVGDVAAAAVVVVVLL